MTDTRTFKLLVLGLVALLPISGSFMRAFSFVGAKNPASEATKPRTLEVTYEPATDLLSIGALQAPLSEVLQEISQKAHLTIESPNKDLLSEQVSVEMERVSLEEAIKELLREFNSAFIYTSSIDPDGRTTTLRLVKVILLSKNTSAPPETNISADERVSSSDPKDERGKKIESLLEILKGRNFLAYPRAIAAIKGLAPEKAVAILARWLESDDPQMRVAAASGLGNLGDETAVEFLAPVLTLNDPRTRQAAASSLAIIGGERATNILFQNYLVGDARTQEAIAVAIASHGDESTQKTLANFISGSEFRSRLVRDTPTAGEPMRPEGPVSYNR